MALLTTETESGETMATVGERIREIREKRGMTQDKLAQAAGISKSFLSEVENDKSNLGAQILLRIANELGASMDYLLDGTVKVSEEKEPVLIPSALSKYAEKMNLTYAETRELLDAHNSVIARRSSRSLKEFAVEDWKRLHAAIKKVFD
jgi:transcriptional regulator with XRE-family HTH domain